MGRSDSGASSVPRAERFLKSMELEVSWGGAHIKTHGAELGRRGCINFLIGADSEWIYSKMPGAGVRNSRSDPSLFKRFSKDISFILN